jgi:hypothetical protein
MDEAIELAIEGSSPYPEKAAFIDADAPSAGRETKRAGDEGKAEAPWATARVRLVRRRGA